MGTIALGRDPLSQRPKREHLFGQASIICFDACWGVRESLLLCVPVALSRMNLSRKMYPGQENRSFDLSSFYRHLVLVL